MHYHKFDDYEKKDNKLIYHRSVSEAAVYQKHSNFSSDAILRRARSRDTIIDDTGASRETSKSVPLKDQFLGYRIPRALRFTFNKSFRSVENGPLEEGGSKNDLQDEQMGATVRKVYINQEDPERGDRNLEFQYPSNQVCTSKYTWWSFVPVYLYLTFTKVANLYFLTVGIFQMIPDISPTQGIPLQFMPLSIVVFIDGMFAAYEDYKRHCADNYANGKKVQKLNRDKKRFEETSWRNLRVGDFVKLYNWNTIPADILLLAVGSGDGEVAEIPTCFVETKSLDGETNLKLREAPSRTCNSIPTEQACVDNIHGVFECELPNGDINTFKGALYLDGMSSENAIPINLNNMLLRGCRLRNTHHIIGLVVNTGVDTKIMQSSGDEFPVKQSTIDKMTNNQVGIVVALLFLACFIASVGNIAWVPTTEHTYLGLSYSFIQMFFATLTTLATLVPITLYVSITIVKAYQVFFMQMDIKMYDKSTDSPMQARNMQLNEQLGQISHLFSDKTGTLTCNIMEFRKCCINGVSYGVGTTAIGRAAMARNDHPEGNIANDSTVFHEPPLSQDELDAAGIPLNMEDAIAKYAAKNVSNINFDDARMYADLAGLRGKEHQAKVEEFCKHLALCHSVLIEVVDDEDDNTRNSSLENDITRYSASSPDEQALVSASKFFGFEFICREPGKLVIRLPSSAKATYDVLQIFEFDSNRKRMSVIVRNRETQIIELLCKGADSVIFPRLSSNFQAENSKVLEKTLLHLEQYAKDGLRTLVIAKRIINASIYNKFETKYVEAQSDLDQVERRQNEEENLIDTLQNELECDLELLGATAIEDRLQDGVPETMRKLAVAGLTIWVLTGDQQDTAINIGYACTLLSNDMKRYVVSGKKHPSRHEVLTYLDELFHARKAECSNNPDHCGLISLVIDGTALGYILNSEDELHLLRFALLCKVVIACRVSPQQKAQLVLLVNDNCPESRTLSIGDGANDVPMIQSAHVGVGIIGEEGMQAVNNSDFAIGQFRFLQNLLLVHGRWNYYRIAHLILFTFYKNVAYCTAMFWYIFYISAFSGTQIYSAFIQQGYNMFFTAVPIVVYACIDKDVSYQMAFDHPQGYYTGPSNQFFNYGVFWKWMFFGLIDSVAILFIPLYGFGWVFPNGRSVDYTVIGTICWTVLCVVVTMRFSLLVHTWNWIIIAGVLFSYFSLYVFQWLVDEIDWSYQTEAFPFVFTDPTFWIVQVLTVVIVISKDFFWKGYQRAFRPEFRHLMQEVQLFKLNDNLDDWNAPQKNNVPSFDVVDHKFRLQENNPPSNTSRTDTYRGFVFDKPVSLIHWITAQPIGKTFKVSKGNHHDLRTAIFASDDPILFENQRFQPLAGFGSSYPGHLLPTDRGKWSNREGKLYAMDMDISGLVVNLNVPRADSNGWVYSADFKRFGKRESKHHRGFVRRRQWILQTADIRNASMS